MTDEQLRELALAATPGPWEASERIVGDAQGNALCMTNLAMPPNEAAALTAYIAAANPATVLALLDEIAALRARAEQAEAVDLSANRFYRLMNGMDEDDYDKRAEQFVQMYLDGLTVGPNNRNTVKAALAEHFCDIAAIDRARSQGGNDRG